MKWIAVLLLALLPIGCAAALPTSDGVARALEAAAPALRGLAADQSEGGGEVTVLFIMPDFGRPWWQMPFTLSDVGSPTVYVILVPGGGHAGETVGRVDSEAAGVPAE